ncbi:gliding motility-associated C-terminal domain-containing protein [Putridiphycobacter roseus]|uniref:gliding motility-associated C-terminal domain-containing protein n=1 Tax=Putridiphycobacter roseus TaxID=2219161 RepID=UPI001314A82B|nr:gliding motility-associated C-terminal domain-containing protein [Putridiphycobacter roseus]
MKIVNTILFTFLFLFAGFAQPGNDDCVNAVEICVNQVYAGTTVGATLENCFSTNPNGCADDNTPCFTPRATVWYKFTTNANGGAVTVNFTNVVVNQVVNQGKALQAVIVESDVVCEGGNYNYFGACQNNGLTDFSIAPTGPLAPNKTYYIQVNGSAVPPGEINPAEVTFDISIAGAGVELLPIAVSIATKKTVICQREDVSVDVTTTNCFSNPMFEWYYNGILVSEELNFSTAILSESGFLYLKANCGATACPSVAFSDSIYFDVTPINADAGPDLLLQLGEAATINGSGTGVPTWTPVTGLNFDNTFTPSASPDVSTTYFLLVVNGLCSMTDEMNITIKSGIDIPEAFTPNGDFNNDVWEIGFIDQYLNNQVTIFDRSGQVVFSVVGYNNGNNVWDGTYKGNPVPASTYFYVIDLRDKATSNEENVYRGSVTVLR